MHRHGLLMPLPNQLNDKITICWMCWFKQVPPSCELTIPLCVTRLIFRSKAF
jgi:hypothetical protein